MQKDSAQAKISLKVVGGLLFFDSPCRTFTLVLEIHWIKLCPSAWVWFSLAWIEGMAPDLSGHAVNSTVDRTLSTTVLGPQQKTAETDPRCLVCNLDFIHYRTLITNVYQYTDAWHRRMAYSRDRFLQNFSYYVGNCVATSDSFSHSWKKFRSCDLFVCKLANHKFLVML